MTTQTTNQITAADTTTAIPTTEESVGTDRPRPRRRLVRRVAAGAIAVVAVATMSLASSSSPASAASFYRPTIDCYDRGVTVTPGVRSIYGESDGYYKVDLYRMYTNGYSQLVRTTQGRVSWNTISWPDARFANLGSGYYAAIVKRWDAVNGSWVRLNDSLAYERHYLYGSTNTPYCQLY